MSSSNYPPPVNRPIRRRNGSPPPAPPAASTAKLSSSSIPSLTAVRRTLFHSSSASRLSRATSQPAPCTSATEAISNNSLRPGPVSTISSGIAPHQIRQEDDELVYRDNEGKVVLEGALNMTHFPRDERTEEESQLERSLISDMYREYQSRYDVDAAELKCLLHESLQQKVASLQEDAWIFGAEEEVTDEQLQ